jgi:hypothetical protein
MLVKACLVMLAKINYSEHLTGGKKPTLGIAENA